MIITIIVFHWYHVKTLNACIFYDSNKHKKIYKANVKTNLLILSLTYNAINQSFFDDSYKTLRLHPKQ